MTSVTRGAGLGLVLLTGLATGTVRAQPPGGFGGRSGGRFGGRFDPSQLFDMMSHGKDVIVRDQLDPRFQGTFDRYAKRMKITDGKMTRQQFTEYLQQRQAKRNRKSGSSSGSDSWAENMFRRYDRRNNGQLTLDEVPDEMKVEYKRWDANGDGFIDLTEFKAYVQARMQQLQSERGSRGGRPSGMTVPSPAVTAKPKPPAPEELPSNFYRRSKLPKEVPPWFTQIDTDGDGQIGVYEWRKSGRPFSEFQAMDRNGDGFVTIEEIVRYVRATTPKSSTGTAVTSAAGSSSKSAGASTGPASSGARRSFSIPGDRSSRAGLTFGSDGGKGRRGRSFGTSPPVPSP